MSEGESKINQFMGPGLSGLTVDQLNRTIIEGMAEGIWVVNTLGRTAFVNPAFASMVGYQLEDLKDKLVIDLLWFDDLTPSEMFLDPSQSRVASRYQAKLRKKDGSQIWVMIGASPIESKTTGLQGTLYLVMNISELKEAERIAEESRLKMAISSRLSSLGEMASGIAHEINNPLAIIKGKLWRVMNRLEKGLTSPEEMSKDMTSIDATVDRITKIVKAMGRISGNRSHGECETLTVRSLVDEVLELSTEKFKKLGVTFEVSVPSDLMINCRAIEINQVLLNLLNNSVDAISELNEKSIRITATEDLNGITLAVADSGRGIPAELTEKILEPFFTTKGPGKGTGLGLSISRTIMTSHDGTMELDRTAKNTTFILKFPKSKILQTAITPKANAA